MEINIGKSHLIIELQLRLTVVIMNQWKNVLLGITIDSNLTFENHINSICKKSSQKLNALVRIAPYMNIKKGRKIMKSFAFSQFSYCLLIWMFYSICLNSKINCIHERAQRMAYEDSTSTFQELLNKDNATSIYHKNLQVLATEMFNILWVCL